MRRISYKHVINPNGGQDLQAYWKVSTETDELAYLFSVPISRNGTTMDYDTHRAASMHVIARFLTLYEYENVAGVGMVKEKLIPEHARSLRTPFADVLGFVATNLCYTTVSPNERVKVHVPTAPLSYADGSTEIEHFIRKAGQSVGLSNVLELSKKAFLSVSSAAACQAALTKIGQDVKCHKTDLDISVRGMRNLMAHFELDQGYIPPPKYNSKSIFSMEFAGNKRSGFTNEYAEVIDGVEIKTMGTKSEKFTHAAFVFFQMMVKCFHKFEVNDRLGTFNRMKKVMASYGTTVVKLSLKTELRQPGDDPEKVRIFFLVSILHYIIAKILFEPLHDYFLGRREYLAGYRMSEGISPLYHLLKGDEGEDTIEGDGLGSNSRTFFCFDIRKKDTRFAAQDLAVIVMLVEFVFDLTADTKENAFTQVLLWWLVDKTAYHNVNWPGGFRFVIGVLFSGDYNTTFLNTIHVLWLAQCYCVFVHKNSKDPNRKRYLTAIRDGSLVVGDAGDDVVGSISDSLPEMSPQGFVDFIKKFNQIIKPESFRVTRTLFSRVTPQGRVSEGIVFLKRYFVRYEYKGEKYVAPFRPTEDYIFRLYRHTTPISDLPTYISRIVGLTLDTHGTNDVAYKMCYNLVAYLIRASETTIYEVQDAMETEEFVQQRKYKMGTLLSSTELFSLAMDKDRLIRNALGITTTPENDTLLKWERRDRPMPFSKY